MKVAQVLDVDFRTEEGREAVQAMLLKIPAIAKRHDEDAQVPLESLEKVIGMICRKYNVMIWYITPTYIPGEVNMYSVTLKTTDTLQWLNNVYGCCLYEAVAKTTIALYAYVKSGKVAKKEE